MAQAEEFTYSFGLAGTSDYVFRGVSQTDNDPTVQGSIDLGYGMFYIGTWASGVDYGPGDDATMEVDWYGGITPSWNNIDFDFGIIAYSYPGATGYDLIEFLEYKTGVSTTISGFAIGATGYWSPEYNNYEYGVYEGSIGYEFKEINGITPSVDGLIGYFDDYNGTLAPDYTYWNAGLALGIGGITLDFRYWDTDISKGTCGNNTCDQRFVFTGSVSVP